MKPLTLSFVLFLPLIVSGCGGASTAFHASSAAKLDGIWTAQALNTDGTRALVFQALMKQASNSAVRVERFSFLVPTPCFPQNPSGDATFTPASNANSSLTGPFLMTVTDAASSDNSTLTLQGSINGPVISGTWNVSSGNASCAGDGTFEMDQLPSS